MKSFVAVFIFGLANCSPSSVNDNEIERIWPGAPPLKYKDVEGLRKNLNSVIKGAEIPALVRLGFHGCAGGCDGCINYEDPNNAGLQQTTSPLETLYRTVYQGRMSRADYWAWSALWAIEKTVQNNNKKCKGKGCRIPKPEFTYKWGRKDCPTSPKTDNGGRLPGAKFSHDKTMDYFAVEFGLTARETVALLGAHTIGRAKVGNSGYHGSWIKGEEEMFNNKYYKHLVDQTFTWKHRPVTPELENQHWQFDSAAGMMLTSDFSLYKEVYPTEEGPNSCRVSETLGCKKTSTASLVEIYAEDNSLWMEDFREVFMKVLENGYDDEELAVIEELN